MVGCWGIMTGMSIWDDVFKIYQSVQEGQYVLDDELRSDGETRLEGEVIETKQTVYVFAYIDDGKGNISRNIAVEDRITMLEMKNQELEYRYNRLLEQLEEESEEDSQAP